jgi:hypothetical protein
MSQLPAVIQREKPRVKPAYRSPYLSPYFVVDGAKPGVESFPLKSTNVVANVSGVIADVALTHEMKSPLSQDLVDRMLKLTELETHRALGSREPVAIGSVIRTIVDGLEPVLVQKQLTVDLQVPDRITVSGDRILIQLALSNLLQKSSGRVEIHFAFQTQNAVCPPIACTTSISTCER